MDAEVLAGWAVQLGSVCMSVDYRLAPEAVYPAAIDDCEAALDWMVRRHVELQVDPARLILFGVSAGGALAAALALRLRDRRVPTSGLLLESPMLDDREATASRSWSVPIAGPTTIRLGWRAYLGDRFGSSDVPADAAPARATNLADLPPTFVAVGTVDTLHDEGIDFAGRLRTADVDVTLREYPGAVHGFATIAPSSRLAHALGRDQFAWLESRLA